MTVKPSYEELERRVQGLETTNTLLEKKLHEARFFSEEIMTYMTEGLVLTDTRGTVIFINQRLSEMLGYLSEEIIGKCWLDLVPPDQDAIAKEAEARRAQGHTDRYEIILHRKDGHKFLVLIGAGPRFDKLSGDFIGTMGVVTDITKNKRLEGDWRESEFQKELILNATSELVAYYDTDLRIKWVNTAAASSVGRRPEEMIGSHCYFFWNHINEPCSDCPVIKARDEKVPQETEKRTPDGRHWNIRGFPILEEDKVIGLAEFSLDITERKQAEEALHRERERLASIIEGTNVGTWEWNVQTGETIFNERWAEIIGYSLKEISPVSIDTWMKFTHPDDLKNSGELLQRHFSGELDYYECEARIRHKNGEWVWVLDRGKVAVWTEDGKPLLILGTHQDITHHKQAEAEREKLQAQLHQAQKMESIGRLAGGVAHDFNNMLGIILGHTELALLQADKNHDLYDDLNEIQKAAKRSADTTKQLLAFARKDIISPKKLDLNDTVESMLNMLRRLIGEDIDLVWKPSAHLWPVKMDPSQIDQILANLCINARDAISGVGKLTIETGRKTFDEEYCKEHAGFIPGDFVLLAVSDNGCGMDKNTLDNLFEPFFTTKEVGKGTGLGLATIYGIVKQNNGFINVYSEPGQGSTFNIYLPRFSADKDTDKAVPEKKAAAGGTETILLVEDEASILRMTRMMLERKGYTVLSAASPAEAVEKAKTHSDSIDLLMTDVIMPEMNGRDLAEKITAFYPGVSLLFMSGYTADVIANQGMLDAKVAFIQKPFSLADMTEKVREVLDMSPDKNQE